MFISLLSFPYQAPKLFEEPAVHPSAVISERCQVRVMHFIVTGEARLCVYLCLINLFVCVCVRSAQMGSDSIIGAMCQVADKTSIKRSTIGNSTTVKEKVKVTNSIIMHGVTIEEG